MESILRRLQQQQQHTTKQQYQQRCFTPTKNNNNNNYTISLLQQQILIVLYRKYHHYHCCNIHNNNNKNNNKNSFIYNNYILNNNNNYKNHSTTSDVVRTTTNTAKRYYSSSLLCRSHRGCYYNNGFSIANLPNNIFPTPTTTSYSIIMQGGIILRRYKWSISLNEMEEIAASDEEIRTTIPTPTVTSTAVKASTHNDLNEEKEEEYEYDDEDDSNNTHIEPQQQQQQQHRVLDVSTYHGWDSVDVQDTGDDNDGGLVNTVKTKAIWDPVKRMVVKQVVTTIRKTSSSLKPKSSLSSGIDSTDTNSSSSSSTILSDATPTKIRNDDFSYDGRNMRIQRTKAELKIKRRQAQNDPLNKLCRKCIICDKHFSGHKSMLSHLIYRDKCYNELDPILQSKLVQSKYLQQQKRIRHKMRKKHLPTYDTDYKDFDPHELAEQVKAAKDDNTTISTTTTNHSDENGADSSATTSPSTITTQPSTQQPALIQQHQHDIRYKLKKVIPDCKRTRLYKEKMRLINEKYNTLEAAETQPKQYYHYNQYPKRYTTGGSPPPSPQQQNNNMVQNK